MPKQLRLFSILLLTVFFSLTQLASGQFRLESQSLNLGLRTEYFSRTLSSEVEGETPRLKAYLVNLALRYDLRAGFSAAILLGYASSNYQELFFRQLPFSIDFEGSGISGLVAGAEIEKNLLSRNSFEVDVLGQFMACLGIKKEFDIPDLVVPGSIEASPSWMRAAVGPVFVLTGWEGMRPYIYPCYNYLWGTFSMDQTVQSLEGTEKKKIKAKSQFGVLFGAGLEISDKFELKAEAGFYPRQGGSDYSVMLQALFGF
jgi:hypothetical protein